LFLTTDYTVSLNADQDSNPGGSLTLLAVLATGFNMIITSDIANLQPTDLTNQGGFYPEVITDALDRATIQIQQMADELTRSIKIPVTDGLSLDMELPTAAARANSFLAFDATGEPTVVTAGSAGSPTSITRQQFSGTGSQVAYTLASDPGALGNSCEVFVGGIYQQRDTYTIAGTTLTFTAAPVAGTDNIEVVNFLTTAIGTTDSSLITYVPAGAGATQRTVQAKLRDVVSVKDFGVVGDNVTDDSAALNLAVAFCVSNNKKLWCPAGMTAVFLSSVVDMKGLSDIWFESPIRVSLSITQPAILLGGFAGGTVCSWTFDTVYNDANIFNPGTYPVIRISGLKRSTVVLNGCNYLQLYADNTNPSTASNGYNNFILGGAHGKLSLTDSGVALSWNNENCFTGGGVEELEIIGVGYQHNHNKFFNNTFESPMAISMQNASENFVYGARFENASSEFVTFDSLSYNNAVFRTWSGAGYVGAKFLNGVSISDTGAGNVVSTEACSSHKPICIFSVTPQAMIVGNASFSACNDYRVAQPGPYFNPTTSQLIVPGLKNLTAVTANTLIAISDYIPVSIGTVIGYSAKFTGTHVRLPVFVFDANMKPLTSEGAGGKYIDTPGVSAIQNVGGYGVYVTGGNLDEVTINNSTTASVRRSDVAYIRIGALSPTANFVFEELSAFVWSPPSTKFTTANTAQRFVGPTILNGSPTKGWLPVGYQILDTSTGPATHRYVSFSYETFLASSASLGATSLTVTTVSTIANSDIVGLLLDNGSTHWSTVSGLAGSTFTVSALPSAAAAGNRIVFNRWTT
jgi:hypothetical protein